MQIGPFIRGICTVPNVITFLYTELHVQGSTPMHFFLRSIFALSGESSVRSKLRFNFALSSFCELCKGSCDTKCIHHWLHSIENSVYSFLFAVFCFKMNLRVLDHRLYHVFSNLIEVGDYQGSAAISNLTRVRRQVLWTDLAGVYLAK